MKSKLAEFVEWGDRIKSAVDPIKTLLPFSDSEDRKRCQDLLDIVYSILDKAKSLLEEERQANETYNSPAYLEMKRAEEQSTPRQDEKHTEGLLAEYWAKLKGER